MCILCGKEVPLMHRVLWCDACMEEFLTTDHGLTIDEFIAKKRQEAIRDAEQVQLRESHGTIPRSYGF